MELLVKTSVLRISYTHETSFGVLCKNQATWPSRAVLPPGDGLVEPRSWLPFEAGPVPWCAGHPREFISSTRTNRPRPPGRGVGSS